MKTNIDKPVKPASKDPVKEAKSHPDGPDLEEMLYGQEEKKAAPRPTSKNKDAGGPDIPVI